MMPGCKFVIRAHFAAAALGREDALFFLVTEGRIKAVSSEIQSGSGELTFKKPVPAAAEIPETELFGTFNLVNLMPQSKGKALLCQKQVQ